MATLASDTGLFHLTDRRDLPAFPSLTERPDDSLRGTVAYYAQATGCVRIVAASGRSARDVLCLSTEDRAVRPEEKVKPAGPQLVWLPDNRLEITMFLWKPESGAPVYSPGWQKIVDVQTRSVVNVPVAETPTEPKTFSEPVVNPQGDRLSCFFDPSNGHVRVTLTDRSGTSRTLLSANGPGEYTYQFGPVFWAPNWEWIAASDTGRILILTPGPPASTRILVTGVGDGAGGGTAGPAFAVVAATLV